MTQEGVKQYTLAFLIVAMTAAFGAGIYVGRQQNAPAVIEGVSNIEAGKPEGVDFSLFWEAWKQLKEKSAQSKELEPQKMVYGAISGMVGSLKDPYTVFMNPQDSKRFLEDVSGSFEGVGMEIGIKKEILTVIAPLEGTPAKRAGIRAGDSIAKINGKGTEAMSVEEAVSLIRGPKGTTVVLSLAREGWKEPKEFSLLRDIIVVPTITWELKGDNKDVAYIKIYHFSENAADEFRKTVRRITDSSAKKIIIDVRDNPGGYLEIAQDIASWFIQRNNVVVIQDPGEQGTQKIFKSKGYGALETYPVAVLINEGSASASEILAGALRDDKSFKLIGTKSFGKGSVQELIHLRDNSAMKVTIAHWLTPKGIQIAEKGLEPDVKVEMTEDDYLNGKDPQLKKAIEVMGGL